MTRFLLSALAALIVAAPALAQNTGLKRLTLREDLFGWEAVGRVDIADQGFCTGVLIAPDLVLTAGHCVFDAATGAPYTPSDITFSAGLRDGEAIAQRPVAAFVPHPAYSATAGTSAANVRHDAALLKLTSAIPSADAAPFPVADTRAADVNVVSYARDRSDALSQQRVCGILGRQEGLFAFDCDVYFGSSVAPVFDMSGNRGRIVSLISAGIWNNGQSISFGMELPQLVDEMKTALRSGSGVVGQDAPQTQSRRLRVGTLNSEGSGGSRFIRP